MAKEKVGAAYGFNAFAVVVLFTLGAMEVLNGMTAWANNDAQVYVNTQDKTYLFHLTPTGWGFTHTLLGIAMVAAAFGIVSGAVWARTVGVVIAVLGAIVGFGFVPIYPVWGILIIALSVTVIWSLTTYGGDLRK